MQKEKIIFRDPKGNLELEKEFNKKVLELAEKKLSTIDFENEFKKIQQELKQKYFDANDKK